QAFSLPVPDLTILYPNGVPTYSSMKADYRNAWAVETSLDLQWAHAIAPCARLVMIVANGGGTSQSGMFKGIASAVAHYPGSVISQSWLSTEQVFQSAMDEQAAKYHQVYQRAVDSGCTVLSCTGDWGTANTDKQGNAYPSPTVAWPASDPLVTACGGTQL